MKGIQAVAVGFIQLCQLVQKTDSSGLIPGKHFADHKCSVYGILVPHIGAGKISIGFFESADIGILLALGFQHSDLFSDELKACQHIDTANPVMGGNPLCHVAGNDGLYKHRILRHTPQSDAAAANIIQQKHSCLVAGQKYIFSILVLYCNSHSVTVRVGGQQQICLALFGILHSQGHSFPDLRIGIGAGREVSIRLFLFLYYGNVGIAAFSQGPQHRLQAGSV